MAHGSQVAAAERRTEATTDSPQPIDELRAAAVDYMWGTAQSRAAARDELDAIGMLGHVAGEDAERADALPLGVEPCTDLGNAYRIAREHGEELKHDESIGWLAWDGRVWTRDATEATRRAMDIARRLMRFAVALLEAAKTDDERDRADALLKHARKSQSEPAIRRALELARHLEPIAAKADAWDRDDWLLTVANGTIELRTGRLREHRRGDMITRSSPVEYEPSAECSAWTAFLARVLPDEALLGFVHRALGYSLTGDTREQSLMIGHGGGANGKSTLIEVARHCLGNYAAHAQTDTFMRVGARGADNDLARLRGARFVTAIESAEGRKLDEERVKQLTGGDTIAARFLYHEAFDFRPAMKIWLIVNHRPEITGTDDGIWRRVRLIPFMVQIPEAERDLTLADKLRAEAPGILRWMVEGCIAWQRDGLQAPNAVTAATSEWRTDANDVSTFVDEHCVVRDAAQVKSGAIYGAYREWTATQGVEALTAKAFGSRVAQMGFRSDRTNAHGRIWRGIGLRSLEHVA